MPTKLDDAKARVLALFTELKAEGVSVMLGEIYGRAYLVLDTGDDSFVELRNVDWHPEWSK